MNKIIKQVGKDPRAFKSNQIISLNGCDIKHWDILTVNQLKLAMLSASKVRLEDTHETEYEITFQEFKALCGYGEKTEGGEQYNRIYKEAQKLARSGVDFITADGDIVIFNWLTSVIIKRKQGAIAYKLDERLIPFYKTEQGNFTIIYLMDLMKLKSKYSILLYEVLCKWKNQGRVYLTIENLRKQLQVPEEKYKRIPDLLAKIINPAIKEVNEKTTTFTAEITAKRGAKGVTEGLMFLIYPAGMQLADTSEDITSIIKLLKEHKISDKKAGYLAARFPLKYIQANLSYVDELKLDLSVDIANYKIIAMEENSAHYDSENLFPEKKVVKFNEKELPDVMKKLISYDLPINLSKALLSEYGEDRINKNLDYALEVIKSSNPAIKSQPAYIVAAIKKDYQKTRFTTKEIVRKENRAVLNVNEEAPLENYIPTDSFFKDKMLPPDKRN